MIDYSKGYTSAFYATVVDPETWTDNDRIELVSGSININDTDLRQSANLEITSYPYDTDKIIRIYMEARQNGMTERVPIFTGWASCSSYSYQSGFRSINVQCYSVLKPADDILIQHGWYVKKGNNCIYELQELLGCTRAPVVFSEEDAEKAKGIEDDIVAEDNETNLSMVEKLLAAMKWVLWITGDGQIVLAPRQIDDSIDEVATFSPNYDVVESDFTVTRDWFECPNCLRVTYNEFTAVAKDENENSPLSIQNRGREIWAVEDNVDLVNDMTLSEYANKRLAELQQRSEIVSYNRRFSPGVNVENKIVMAYSQLNGEYIITSQNITLGHAAVVSEEIRRSI